MGSESMHYVLNSIKYSVLQKNNAYHCLTLRDIIFLGKNRYLFSIQSQMRALQSTKFQPDFIQLLYFFREF